MTHRTKQTILLCFVAGLMATLLLSVSLSSLSLRAGMPFPGAQEAAQAVRDIPSVYASHAGSLPVLELVLGAFLIALIIYLPARVISLVNVRKLLLAILGIIAFIVLLRALPRTIPGPAALPTNEVQAPGTRPPTNYPVSPLGQAPPFFLWLAGGCLLLGSGLLAARLLKSASDSTRSRDKLAQTAEEALHDLSLGLDFPDVIIACYLRMTDVLRAERKLEREHAMTVREFQDWLELKGLPPEPTRQLTQLFEKARYGNERMSPLDEDTGKDCLEQIIVYCRRTDAEAQWTGQ